MNLEFGSWDDDANKSCIIVVPYIVSYRPHNIVKQCVFVRDNPWDALTILSLLALGWGIP